MVYEAGYISATTGSNQVEGFGTCWLSYCHAGDVMVINDIEYEILSIDDNHLLTLSVNYFGESIESGNYIINTLQVIKTLDELKVDAVLEINRLAGDKIILIYPIYKQLNIGRSVDAPLMWAWIDSVRDLSNAENSAVNLAADSASIQSVIAGFKAALEML